MQQMLFLEGIFLKKQSERWAGHFSIYARLVLFIANQA